MTGRWSHQAGTGLGMWPRDKSRVAHQRDAAHCHPAHRIPDRRCGQVETFRARLGGEARGPGLNQKSPELPLNGIAHFNFRPIERNGSSLGLAFGIKLTLPSRGEAGCWR